MMKLKKKKTGILLWFSKMGGSNELRKNKFLQTCFSLNCQYITELLQEAIL